MSAILRFVSSSAGIDLNTNGGCYKNGSEYDTIKKVEVEVAYWRLREELGRIPTCRVLAKEARVGRTFARKVIKDYFQTQPPSPPMTYKPSNVKQVKSHRVMRQLVFMRVVVVVMIFHRRLLWIPYH